MTSAAPIEIVNLRKEYKKFVAVDNLSISIEKNSFTGLLGPNGAGKSTTLKILTHLTSATSGKAYINGIDVTENPKEALQNVGTVVETPEFYLYLTPRETMKYIGEILGMSHESIAAETDEILEKVKMTEWADKRLGTFSKGMRQRIALGQALMNSPNIIILDEPTSGLDPRGMAETREILKNIRSGGNDLTVLMSSHLMHEVSDLCNRVAMMDHGVLLLHDDMEKVLVEADVHTILVKTLTAPDGDAVSAISALDGVIEAGGLSGGLYFKFKGDRETQSELLASIGGMGLGVYSFSESGNALEERYLGLIKDSR